MDWRQLTEDGVIELLTPYHRTYKENKRLGTPCRTKTMVTKLVKTGTRNGGLVSKNGRFNECNVLCWAAKKLKKGKRQFPGVPDKFFYSTSGSLSVPIHNRVYPSTYEDCKAALLNAWDENMVLQEENKTLKAELEERKAKSKRASQNAKGGATQESLSRLDDPDDFGSAFPID